MSIIGLRIFTSLLFHGVKVLEITGECMQHIVNQAPTSRGVKYRNFRLGDSRAFLSSTFTLIYERSRIASPFAHIANSEAKILVGQSL